MIPRRPAALLVAFLSPAAGAQEMGAPLSAIDWLSRSVEGPAALPPPTEPPVAGDATSPVVTVTPLDGARPGGAPPRAIGVLASATTGLPPTLWSASDEGTLIALIRAEQVDTLPALRDLMTTLMLAEAAPSTTASPDALFLARVDKLLDLGAVEPAQALLEAGDLLRPEAFRRWFDVSLLTGTEAAPCDVLRTHPRLAPTLMARVFCTARNGDWPAAALTLGTARALGDVTAEEEALLSRFLDPEFAAEDGGLAPASRPSPLDFRLREAIGETLPTAGLPLAFSHADLRPTAAWRAQIEAAERLARHGALPENALLGLYTSRRPAASGGVWDRATAIQAFEAAIDSGDRAAIAAALEAAWPAMEAAGLDVAFARLYGDRLAGLALEGPAAAIALRATLLSPSYAAAATAPAATARERLWQAVARGEAGGLEPGDGPSAAVIAGFSGAPVPPRLALHIAEGRTGEAILRAIAAFDQGLDGDYAAVTDAIATLRALGLEDVARRAALQFLILGRAA